MNKPEDFDKLFESFMSENHVEDGGFSEKVIAEISAKPRLAFVTNIYPLLGGLFGLLLFIFAKQNLLSMDLSFFNRFTGFINHEYGTAATLYSAYGKYAMMAGCVLIGVFYLRQPEKN
jgi:hypothetical protein